MNIDDKTLIAKYAAKETARINERLKEMLNSNSPPSEELRQDVVNDIEATLERLQRALSHIHIDEDYNEEEELNDE